VLLWGMMLLWGVASPGNRWNRSCRREADCGLLSHANTAAGEPDGSSQRLPQREHLSGAGFES